MSKKTLRTKLLCAEDVTAARATVKDLKVDSINGALPSGLSQGSSENTHGEDWSSTTGTVSVGSYADTLIPLGDDARNGKKGYLFFFSDLQYTPSSATGAQYIIIAYSGTGGTTSGSVSSSRGESWNVTAGVGEAGLQLTSLVPDTNPRALSGMIYWTRD